MTLYIILAIGVTLIIVYYILYSSRKEKGSDTPEQLRSHFGLHIEWMETLVPFNIIFEEYSNDGNQIVFKEKTESRNCYIRFERYKIILDVYTKDDHQIFYSEDSSVIWKPDQFLDIIHRMYVTELTKAKIN